MKINLDEQNKVEKRYDVCVIGSGPAGMTIANELFDTNLSVCILESGNTKTSKHADKLRKVISKGIEIKPYSRERIVGGTSKTWAGLSSLYDPEDFEERNWLGFSGWPISYKTLVTYYSKAAERYDFPNVDLFELENNPIFSNCEDDVSFDSSKIEEKIFLAKSEPQRFGEMCKDIFDKNIDLYINTTTTELLKDKSNSVQSVLVKNSEGKSFEIKSNIFIVAAGGIDNAVILLNSKTFGENGLGNEYDTVGRFLMNHPKGNYGTLKLKKPIHDAPCYFGLMSRGFAGYMGFRLKREDRDTNHLLNSYVRFEPVFPWSNSRGVESLINLVKKTKLVFNSWKKLFAKRSISIKDYSETGDDSEIQNSRISLSHIFLMLFYILIDLPKVLLYLLHRIFPSLKTKIKKIKLRNFLEMQPLPTNRVYLSNDSNELNIPIPVVEHEVSSLDKQSVLELHRKLKDAFADIGDLTGDLQNESQWPLDQDASHYMGTTRMGNNPETSVVDENCKVHSVDNVYITGSSVFSTSGCVNPTMTIVALSIRLADHIKKIYKDGSK